MRDTDATVTIYSIILFLKYSKRISIKGECNHMSDIELQKHMLIHFIKLQRCRPGWQLLDLGAYTCKLKKLAFREFTDYNSYSIFHFQHSFLACLFLLFPDILVKEMHRIRLPFIVTKKTLTCCYSWVLYFHSRQTK